MASTPFAKGAASSIVGLAGRHPHFKQRKVEIRRSSHEIPKVTYKLPIILKPWSDPHKSLIFV